MSADKVNSQGRASSSFGKDVFHQHVEAECERRLLWLLGANDPDWLVTARRPEPSQLRAGGADLGKQYERAIYEQLCALEQAEYLTLPSGALDVAPLSAERLRQLAAASAADLPCDRLLLEHHWSMTRAFVRHVFDVAEGAPDPLPIQQLTDPRPDMIVVEARVPERDELEVLPGGLYKQLEPGERRLRLSIIDIKHTSAQRVGKRHFVELLFYAHSLSSWIQERGLDAFVYVSTHGHAILPFVDPCLLRDAPLNLSTLRRHAVVMSWQDVQLLFDRTRRSIAKLYKGRKHKIEEITPRISPACGYCAFLADCKKTLMNGSDDPARWDVRLLPYVSSTLADELHARGIKTVGAAKMMNLTGPHNNLPDPVFSAQPLLILKAKALIQKRVLDASPANTNNRNLYSDATPRRAHLNLFFNAEADPVRQRVFAFGMRLEAGAGFSSACALALDALFTAWRALLAQPEPPADEHVAARVLAALPLEQRAYYAGLSDDEHADGAIELRALILQSWRALCSLERDQLCWFDGDERGSTRLSYTFSYINLSSDQAGEQELCRQLVRQIFALTTLCHAAEALTASMQPADELLAPGQRAPSLRTLDSAIFYWSAEQLIQLEELMERHLPALLQQQEQRQALDVLIRWLAPARSRIKHHALGQKLFDVRAMVERVSGYPHIINTTWHKLYELSADGKWGRNAKFWGEHFNYMDASAWHEFLQADDSASRAQLEQEIKRQLGFKLNALKSIYWSRSKAAQEQLLAYIKPLHTKQIFEPQADAALNPIAALWVSQARLAVSVQRREARATRLTCPDHALGKLAAAEAGELTIDREAGTICFTLAGISSNAKFKVRDYALLMPDAQRNESNAGRWAVRLDALDFDSARKCYKVTARPTSRQREDALTLLYKLLVVERAQQPIYLYPDAGDVWLTKLIDGKEAMLIRDDGRLGRSWLGQRLARRWGIAAAAPSPAPASCQIEELVLYAPDLIPAATPCQDALRTTSAPTPDPSQLAAIRLAMGQHLTCLQGPPGTGKSQTIAALIDEFLWRHEGAQPATILVTAFSYDAMSVLARKLRSHRDATGQLTRAGSAQLVFCRAESRGEPVVPDEGDLPHVIDLMLTSSTMHLDGVQRGRSGGARLETHLEHHMRPGQPLIMLSNAHQLHRLAKRDDHGAPYFLRDGFAFDMIIVDESSQLPVDQFIATLPFIRRGEVRLRSAPDDALHVEARADQAWTKIVLVGDQHQLPPVQPAKPPRELAHVVGSLFDYMVTGHKLPHHQLSKNYRSNELIVEYTRSLGIYAELTSHWGAHNRAPLPAAPVDAPPWVRAALAPEREVISIIHERQSEASISQLEALLAADLCVALRRQLGVVTPEQERRFWTEQLGVVTPHNAQGRLIGRAIRGKIGADTRVEEAELIALIRDTIHSVEKFQGSDRTCIIASIAVSSIEQLQAEEEFLYDLNRFNVLTSRAKQKMILISSRNFLEYIPAERDLMRSAALIRSYALNLCAQPDEPHTFTWPSGDKQDPLTIRYA